MRCNSRDEHAQGFNHWYYDDNGGNFNRDSYIDLFRDLSWGYGNPTSYNPESSFFPAGLQGGRFCSGTWENVYDPFEDSVGCTQLADRMLTNPIRNLYDREFNPTAQYPVIVFLRWRPPTTIHRKQITSAIGIRGIDPGARSQRLDIGIAVDFNEKRRTVTSANPLFVSSGNLMRTAVWMHCATSRKPATMPIRIRTLLAMITNPYTKPDRNGKKNGVHQDEETFLDYGLGRRNLSRRLQAKPSRKKCPFDYGEGNGVFDNNPNVDNFFANDSRTNIKKSDVDAIKRLNVLDRWRVFGTFSTSGSWVTTLVRHWTPNWPAKDIPRRNIRDLHL